MRGLLTIAVSALLLGGCAHPWNSVNLPAGTTRDQVIAQSGPPARVVPLPDGGQRLQYTLQPTGRYAFMVDLDAAGRVVRSRQVLTEAEFNRIEPERWTRADVEREFGPPAWTERVASFAGSVMTYRWKAGNEDMFYYVYVDPQGVVRRAHPGMEFINAPSDRGL
jgi:hypothetical protein